MPSTSSSFIRYVSDEIDLTDSAVSDLGTSFATGQYFHPIGAQVVLTDKAGTVVVPAIVRVGANDSDYNDIVTAKTVGGILNEIVDLTINNDVQRVPYETEMKVKVTGATGIGLTLKGKVVLYGFYQ